MLDLHVRNSRVQSPRPRLMSEPPVSDRKSGRPAIRMGRIREGKITTSSKSKASRHGKSSRSGRTHRGRSSRSGETSDEDGLSGSSKDAANVSIAASRSFPRAVSPSMLSVASTSTRVTNASNDSNSTITQERYDRKVAEEHHVLGVKESTSRSSEACADNFTKSASANLHEDSMAKSIEGDSGVPEDRNPGNHHTYSLSDTESPSPTGTSDLSSSESPETPSSRSTVPSSASDAHRNPSHRSRRSGHTSFDSESEHTHRVRSDGESYNSQHTGRVPRRHERDRYDHGLGHSHSSAHQSETWNTTHSRSRDRQSQEDARSEYLARSQYSQVDAPYHAPRTDLPRQPQYVYHQPRILEQPTMPSHGHRRHGSSHSSPGSGILPMVPEAPDFSKTTLAGYELLASKLSDTSSSIRPAYRKFEALHHRVLLHIQDELCELEEQLRRMDEIAAQMSAQKNSGVLPPASRREEAFYGNDLHVNRTHLLGHIFVKMEQYRKFSWLPDFSRLRYSSLSFSNLTCSCRRLERALSAYSDVTKSMDRPEEKDVAQYREWLAANRPVHHNETSFLKDSKDLVALPPRAAGRHESTGRPSAGLLVLLPFLPLGTDLVDMVRIVAQAQLTFPAVMFFLVPTLLGRIFVTAVTIAAGWYRTRATTDSRSRMPERFWAIAVLTWVHTQRCFDRPRK